MICNSSYHRILTQSMTMCAMIIETSCPCIGFGMLVLLRYQYHHDPRKVRIYQNILWYASILPLWTLHMGLLFSLRLPNWQIISITALTLWIPTNIWDRIEYQWNGVVVSLYKDGGWMKQNQQNHLHADDVYKKTDGDISNDHTLDTAFPTTDDALVVKVGIRH